jgi:hypothetical protein
MERCAKKCSRKKRKKVLTESALLEMDDYHVNEELARESSKSSLRFVRKSSPPALP